MSQPNDQFYDSKRKKITNVLQNSNLGISRVTSAGSRAKREHEPDSDQDVIIAASGDPSRDEFYPKLIEVLEDSYPEAKVYPG